MKRLAILAVICWSIWGGISIAAAEGYLIQPQDVLTFSVWGHEDMQIKELIVRPDGKISIPLAGELQAAGLTTADLMTEITGRLSEYLVEPKVAVNVVKFHTTRVYVLGEVAKPGLYELEKQHNLLDAIGIAQGYTKDAAKRKVFIIRKDQTDKPLQVNLLNLLKKGDMSQNYVLNDGDVVFLSNNHRIDFARDILPWISAAYQVHDIQNND